MVGFFTTSILSGSWQAVDLDSVKKWLSAEVATLSPDAPWASVEIRTTGVPIYPLENGKLVVSIPPRFESYLQGKAIQVDNELATQL